MALAADPDLARAAALLPTTDAAIDRLLAHNAEGPSSVRTFVILTGALVVGTVTLKKLDATDHSAELAYWVGKEHHRKGYAVAGGRLAVAYAFDELLVDYVHSHCLKENNVASLQVLRRLGFTPDTSKADIATEGRFADHFPEDHWTFVRLNRPADITGAAKVYARRWDERMTQYCAGRTSCFELVEELMRQMLKGETLRVLDIGCGTGTFTARQLEIATPKRHFTAVDGSAKNLLVAKHVVGSDPRVTFVRADLTSAEWTAGVAPGSVDAAFLGWVTHEIAPQHLPQLYANLARMLRPSGLLFNVDFMEALQPNLRNLSSDHQRHRVSDDFKAYEKRFEQLQPVVDAMAEQQKLSEKTNLYHSPDTHIRHLHHAGFAEAEAIWRYLGFSMVMAVR